MRCATEPGSARTRSRGSQEPLTCSPRTFSTRSSGGRKLVQQSSSVQAGGCWCAPECTVRAPSCSGSDVRHRKTEAKKKATHAITVINRCVLNVWFSVSVDIVMRPWTFFGKEKCITYQRHQRLLSVSVDVVFRPWCSVGIDQSGQTACGRERKGRKHFTLVNLLQAVAHELHLEHRSTFIRGSQHISVMCAA